MMMKMMMTEKSMSEVFNNGKSDQVEEEEETDVQLVDEEDSRDKLMGRRVSFPVDDLLVTGYVEPPNPWEKAVGVTTSDLVTAYIAACDKNRVEPLAKVVRQLQEIDDFAVRFERLDLQDEVLEPRQVEALEEVFKRMQFEYLDLENASLDDESAAAIFDMVEYYESAKRINISRNRLISTRVWQSCCHMIKRTRGLEELAACSMIVDESISMLIARTLRGNIRLTTLRLENCNLSGRPLCTLLLSLRVNSTLREMHLANNKMTADDATHIANFLRYNCTVKLLDLSDNHLEDKGIQLLVDGLWDQFGGEGGFVVTLKVANTRMTSISMTQLSRVLGAKCPLEMLDLSHNELFNEGIHNVKSALLENHSLQRLMLNGCRITCEGAVAIAEVMANNPVMETLEMSENCVGLGGLMALAHSAKINTKITGLKLDDADTLLPAEDINNERKEHTRLLAEINSYCHRNRDEALRRRDAEDQQPKVPVDAPKGPLARLLSLWARNPTPGSNGSHINGKMKKKNKKSQSLPSPVASNLQELPRSNSLQLPPASPSVSIPIKDHHHHPLKSPLPSPLASPIPSPTRSRFRVSRVCLGECAEVALDPGTEGSPREGTVTNGTCPNSSSGSASSSCSSSSSDEELCFGKSSNGIPSSAPPPTRKFKFTVTPVKTVNGVAQSPPNEPEPIKGNEIGYGTPRVAALEREIWQPQVGLPGSSSQPVWSSSALQEDAPNKEGVVPEGDENLAGGCDRDSGIYLLDASGDVDCDGDGESEPKRPLEETGMEGNDAAVDVADDSVAPRESCSSDDSALGKDDCPAVCYNLVDIETYERTCEEISETTSTEVRVGVSDLLTGECGEDVFGPVSGEHDDLMLFTELTILDTVDSKCLLDVDVVLRRDSCRIEVIGEPKSSTDDVLYNGNVDELSLATTGSS